MGHSSTVVTGPAVSIYDVKVVLGTNTQDLGSLCKSPLINKWALHKPFRNTAVAFASDAARRAALVAANYGLTWQGYDTAADFIDAIDRATQTWWHLAPRGVFQYNEWYRLLDFKDYDHASPCPFFILRGSFDGNAAVGAGITNLHDDPFLPADLQNYYWAFTIKNTSVTPITYRTYISTEKVSQNNEFAVYNLKSLAGTGLLKCYPFLVPGRPSNPGYDATNLHLYDFPATYAKQIIPFPTECGVIEIDTSDLVLKLTAVTESHTQTGISWHVTVKNENSVAVSWQIVSATATYELGAGSIQTQDVTSAFSTIPYSIAAGASHNSQTRSYGASAGISGSVEVIYKVNGVQFTFTTGL